MWFAFLVYDTNSNIYLNKILQHIHYGLKKIVYKTLFFFFLNLHLHKFLLIVAFSAIIRYISKIDKLGFWDFRKQTTLVLNSEKFDNAAEFWETKSYMSLLEKRHCISSSSTRICIFYKWTYKHSTCSFSWFFLELHSNSIVPQKNFIVCSKIPCMKLLYQIETSVSFCVAEYFKVRNFCEKKFHDFLIFWQIRKSLELLNI